MRTRCRCGTGYYNPAKHQRCYECGQAEREAAGIACLWCGNIHPAKYAECFACKRQADRGEEAQQTRTMVIARDRFLCRMDRNDAGLKVAHIQPCIMGGTGQPWNLFTICQDCNQQKIRKGWTIPGPYAAQLELSYEIYLGRLWDFLTADQQLILANEAETWFEHRVVL